MPDLTEEMAVEAVKEVLSSKRQRFEDVTPQTRLADLDLDSLEVAELFATLEDRSGLELDPDSASSFQVVADLALLQRVA